MCLICHLLLLPPKVSEVDLPSVQMEVLQTGEQGATLVVVLVINGREVGLVPTGHQVL